MNRTAMAKKENKRMKKSILCVLAAAVVIITASWLALPAITADDPHCGIEDPAHEHVLACYSDPEADVETSEVWEETLPSDLSGNIASDVVLVAESQVGYEESTANYYVAEGDVQKGYSRYGAWYGDNYCDWNVPFAAFCLEYGGASYDLMPETEECSAWMDLLDNTGYFALADSGYVPAAGDLLFISGDVSRVAVISEVSENGKDLTVIEGDCDGSVQTVMYNIENDNIIGYGLVAGNKDAAEEENVEDTDQEQQVTEDTDQEQEITAYASGTNTLTYSDSEKTGEFETVNNSNYPSSSYRLKVEKLNASDYKTNAEKFMGTAPEEFAAYKIALVDTRNNGSQEVQNYNGNYRVELTFSNGVFESSDPADYFYLVYEYDGALHEVTPTAIEKNDAGNVTRVAFEGNRYPRQNNFILIRHSEPRTIVAGQRVLKYNTVKDAFITDPAYADYYNENSPIGTAGSFHIVAFDTANLSTHTNGNILANTLKAGSNFGTSPKEGKSLDELTYVQHYENINANSASDTKHILALGSYNDITLMDNNNAIGVNGTKIDKPYNYICDIDSDNHPFIDLVRVENEIKTISAELSRFTAGGAVINKNTQYGEVVLNKPSGIGVVNMTASEMMAAGGSENRIRMDGFSEGVMGTIIMNIDCTGKTVINMPKAYIYVDGKEQATSEVIEFSAGKVIWNFLNAEGVTINTNLMTGMVIAPGAFVDIQQNLNGTVVAENVKVSAESHRTDFTGTLVEAVDNGVVVKKIKSGYVGTALSGAVFDLYEYKNSSWVKVASSLQTGSSGYMQLGALDVSVAYKLVETSAPSGYAVNAEPTYFWVRQDKSKTVPDIKPDNFSGQIVEVGGMLLVANEPAAGNSSASVKMQITKEWKNASGTPVDEISVQSIDVTIFRTTNNDQSTRTVWRTVKLTKDSNWTLEIADVPVSETNSSGVTSMYTYEAAEVNVPDGFEATYGTAQNNDVIDITITNTKEASGGYELPDAGGMGTTVFTITGILLMLLALAMLYRRRSDK